MKDYVVIAGVNGAGKTTLYNTNQIYAAMPRVNLDEIVRTFGSWKNPKDVIKAGLISARRVRDYLRDGVSFNQETTLCGKGIIKNIRLSKEKGYYVTLYYVGLDSPALAKERVRKRVEQGGHGIPDKDIERRYSESLLNLKLVLPLCDRALIYDNSEEFINLAEFRDGVCQWFYKKLPRWMEDAGLIHPSN